MELKYFKGGGQLAPLPTIYCVTEPPMWLSYNYILTKEELTDHPIYFISETLSQLIEGGVDTQSNVQSSGGGVSPYVRTPHDSKSLYGITNDKLPVIYVDFDISVEVQEGTGTKGSVGVVAGIFALGSHGESRESS